MVRSPKGKQELPALDPRGGDAILKRMLQTKPKTHDEMVKGRHRDAATARNRKKRDADK